MSHPRLSLGKIWAICQMGRWRSFRGSNSRSFLSTKDKFFSMRYTICHWKLSFIAFAVRFQRKVARNKLFSIKVNLLSYFSSWSRTSINSSSVRIDRVLGLDYTEYTCTSEQATEKKIKSLERFTARTEGKKSETTKGVFQQQRKFRCGCKITRTDQERGEDAGPRDLHITWLVNFNWAPWFCQFKGW